jgi:hypothetical protein
MRTTVELSDDLFRRAKAEAALRGRRFKDLVEEGLRLVLEGQPNGPPGTAGRPTLYDLTRDASGIVDSGVDDLASNPRHLEGLGRDSMGNR